MAMMVWDMGPVMDQSRRPVQPSPRELAARAQAIRPNQSSERPAAAMASSAPRPARMKDTSVSFRSLVSFAESDL